MNEPTAPDMHAASAQTVIWLASAEPSAPAMSGLAPPYVQKTTPLITAWPTMVELTPA